jgi:Acetyltransferase (GNAT) domain
VTAATHVYSADALPPSLTWQALSFLRYEWPFLFSGASRLRTVPFGDDYTRYVTRTDGEVLLSYAEILRVTALRAGSAIRVLGLSNVVTAPPYRREGHASDIVRVVGDLVDASDAEVAILFCEAELVPFYGSRGWVICPASSVQAPGAAPATMARPGPALPAPLPGWLAAAPVFLDARW